MIYTVTILQAKEKTDSGKENANGTVVPIGLIYKCQRTCKKYKNVLGIIKLYTF